MDIVYQSDDQTITVYFDPSSIILMIEFNGIVIHQTYQEAYTEFIKSTKTHNCKKFIYHTKKLKKVSVKSRIWYLKHVAPAIFQEGIRTAIVNAEQIGNQIATDTMREALIEMGYGELSVKRFDTLDEALIWLDPKAFFPKS